MIIESFPKPTSANLLIKYLSPGTSFFNRMSSPIQSSRCAALNPWQLSLNRRCYVLLFFRILTRLLHRSLGSSMINSHSIALKASASPTLTELLNAILHSFISFEGIPHSDIALKARSLSTYFSWATHNTTLRNVRTWLIVDIPGLKPPK